MRIGWTTVWAAWGALCYGAWGGAAGAAEDHRERPQLRRPVGLVHDEIGQRLYVANRCGTLSTLDTVTGRVLSEVAVGERLEWLAPLGEGGSDHLVAVDSRARQLLVLRKAGKPEQARVEVAVRIGVEGDPVYCVSDDRGSRLFVATRWARRVVCWERTDDGDRPSRWRRAWQVDTPFAPRVLTWVAATSQLLVADAFGGRIGVIAGADGKWLRQRAIPGHQFRGMALMPDGETLVLAQQILNPLARTDDNDVHWGILMSNDLRWLKLSALQDPRSDLFERSYMTPLGEASHAAADPAGVLVLADSTVVVTLGGVGEIAYGKPGDYVFRRMRVGRRPTALVHGRGRLVYIADTLDDTISVVDLAREERTAVWSLGPRRPLSLAERGEVAFYDGKLSMDGWMSCHSCHIDGHTNSQLNDNISDGGYETPKRVLSLLGKEGTAPFAWGGTSRSLETQVRRSIEKTMRFRGKVEEETVRAIAAFVRSLPPPPGIDVARAIPMTASARRGKRLFGSLGCTECHAPPRYTSDSRYDVGLADERGMRQFNPPSLLGVSQRDRFLHDGRAAALGEVFSQHGHQLDVPLEAEELADLLAFLRRL